MIDLIHFWNGPIRFEIFGSVYESVIPFEISKIRILIWFDKNFEFLLIFKNIVIQIILNLVKSYPEDDRLFIHLALFNTSTR